MSERDDHDDDSNELAVFTEKKSDYSTSTNPATTKAVILQGCNL